jgi:hypothetical protein
MYSVIVPTMWRSNETEKMLPIIDMHPLVGEIILINNAVHCTPDWFLNEQFWTVNRVDQKENIYVNPAWNLGVSLAKYDKICLWSDDVYFDTEIFDVLADKLSPNDGIVGPSMIPPANNSGIQIHNRPMHENMGQGFGTLMFFNKTNYVPIPKPLKIFFGDVWMYCQSIVQYKEPRLIYNFNIRTLLGTTSLTASYGAVQNYDNWWWREYIKDWKDIINYKEP